MQISFEENDVLTESAKRGRFDALSLLHFSSLVPMGGHSELVHVEEGG